MPFSYKRNLFALYLIKVAKWMNLIMPVIVLFYKENGLSMQQIFWVQSTYSFTLMFLEIPTGYLADKIGRKKSIMIGAFLGSLGYVMYSLSHGFWDFVIAEVILGVSLSLVSGADSAILFDSLAIARKESRYTQIEGRITSYGNFGEAFAGIIGGLLATMSLRMPFYVQIFISLIAIPAAFMLVEPPLHTPVKKFTIKEMGNIIYRAIHKDTKLKWNTLFSSFIGVSTLAMAWLTQAYFKHIQLPVSMFGITWAGLNLVTGFAALFVWQIDKKYGVRKTVYIFTAALFFCYLFLPFVPWYAGISLLFIFYIARGMATPTLRYYVNIITTSDTRATVMSVRNFLIRFLFAITGPVWGWLVDNYSLNAAILSAGIFYGIFSFISLFYFIKHKTYQPYQ